MNPQTLDEAVVLFRDTMRIAGRYPMVKIVVCPPFVFLERFYRILQEQSSFVELGAQNIFWETHGAYTGEISPGMLKALGVSHILIGHSERRYALGETDEMINKKIKAALEADIRPVVLVGERDKDDVQEDMLIDQVSADVSGLSLEQISALTIGYEPVWAISTSAQSRPGTPEHAQTSIALIQKIIQKDHPDAKPVYLYGGSINDANATAFLNNDSIQGAIVGSASLDGERFEKLIAAVASLP